MYQFGIDVSIRSVVNILFTKIDNQIKNKVCQNNFIKFDILRETT